MIGGAVAAVGVLVALVVLLLFAPLAGGAGAVIVVLGLLWLVAYVIACTATLTWMGLTRARRALLANVGRHADAPPRPRVATVPSLAQAAAGVKDRVHGKAVAQLVQARPAESRSRLDRRTG